METAQRFKQGLNLCFSIFKRIFSGSALFRRAAVTQAPKKGTEIGGYI